MGFGRGKERGPGAGSCPIPRFNQESFWGAGTQQLHVEKETADSCSPKACRVFFPAVFSPRTWKSPWRHQKILYLQSTSIPLAKKNISTFLAQRISLMLLHQAPKNPLDFMESVYRNSLDFMETVCGNPHDFMEVHHHHHHHVKMHIFSSRAVQPQPNPAPCPPH